MHATHVQGSSPLASGDAFVRGRAGQLLFLLTIALGVLVNWLAPHPPMTDLPQHAGQVALLRDILFGQSAWSELFRINWLTPYVIGYGLALPLSLFMPVVVAFKLMLSAAYVAFVWLCILIRRHFQADARMDWLFLLPFFGFAYQWGFLTFLIAAPIGLWFILLADRFAQRQTLPSGIALTLVGLLLLASHGLVFVFAVATGGCLLLARVGLSRRLAIMLVPYVILGTFCIIYFIISRQVQAGMESSISSEFIWSSGIDRIPKALIFALGVNAKGIEPLVFVPTALMLFALPWLLGLRVNVANKPSWIPFVVVATIMLLVPTFALDTQFLYQRFGLFLIPAYAWIFTRQAQPSMSSVMRMTGTWTFPMAMVLVLAALSVHGLKAWSFWQETAEIDAQIAKLEPNQRALTLMFDPLLSESDGAKIYGHYPAWYQAERHGLVDFNFAWFPPQIVRYRPDQLPVASPGFEWHPERFDWQTYRGEEYRYFFVRHGDVLPDNLFTGAACIPHLMFEGKKWKIFERRECSG